MSVFNINDYKKALLVIKDLYQIQEVIKNNKRTLAKYTKYRPIKQLYIALLEADIEVNTYVKACEKIIKTKGSIDG